MRCDERAVAVHRAGAVAVSVGAEAGVVLTGDHRPPQRLHVWLNRFRVAAAEQRIARAADLVAGNAVSRQQFAQQAAGGAMHRVHDEAVPGVAQPAPIDQLLDGFQIRRAHPERLN